MSKVALTSPLLSLGGYSVYGFGVLLALIFLLGAFLFWRWARQEGFASDAIFDLVFLPSSVALLTGRLSYLFLTGSAVTLFAAVRVGEGIFWAPAFIAGLATFYLYTRRRAEWSFSKLADLAAPVLALGQGLVFLVAEAVSYLRLAALAGVGYLALFALLALIRKKRMSSGVVFSIYLAGSGLLTLFFEGQREAKAVVLGINLNYLFAAALVALGILMFLGSFAPARNIVSAFRREVAAFLPFRRLEKQLQFKLKGRRRFFRLLWSGVRRKLIRLLRPKDGSSEKETISS